MGAIGYRQKGDTGPMYNPERDYAYITPTLMRIAIENLEANEPTDKVQWREQQNITTEEINGALTALACAQRDFVNAADPVKNFDQALTRYDFYNYRYAVRQYVFATVGEIFCAAWFKAVREVSVVGEESPAHADMSRFSAAVREFTNRHRGVTYDAHFMAEHLRMYQDVLRAREQQLVAELKERTLALSKCAEELHKYTQAQEKPTSIFARLFGAFRKKK